ncbi:hypothetical protein [Streptomyces sp. CB01881]|uniref:hypothetical protein n=1 Tax=Streptomyces sp. CB01881 TaxID=2078691 RepID=UPI0011DF44EE|nr:hypothetical protein [Streptomyces sp. CB01881]TYC77077.1 hypothetical protein EH183_06070 [Streptomyces sp. CB01881]
MTHAYREPVDKRQCPAAVTLPPADLDRFDTMPDAAFTMVPQLRCELVAGHGGAHSALVQGSGYDLHWASWPQYAVEKASRCPAAAGPVGPPHLQEPEICLLREGHPGDHYGETLF